MVECVIGFYFVFVDLCVLFNFSLTAVPIAYAELFVVALLSVAQNFGLVRYI